jgi:hypothetical protein
MEAPLDVTFNAIDAVTDAASIGSLNVIVSGTFVARPIDPLDGLIETTVGGISSRVVNENEKSDARRFPAASFTPVLIVAVNVDAFGNAVEGMSNAVRVAAVYVTVAAIEVPLDVFRIKFVAFTVFGSRGSLNVAVTVDAKGTFVVPLGGLADVTVGGVTSGIVIAAAAFSAD